MSARPAAKASWAVGNTLVVIAALVPVLWLASLSFKDPSTIADGSFLPRRWTLANYRGIFQTSVFTRALVNSIGIALIATVLAVAVGSIAAAGVVITIPIILFVFFFQRRIVAGLTSGAVKG